MFQSELSSTHRKLPTRATRAEAVPATPPIPFSGTTSSSASLFCPGGRQFNSNLEYANNSSKVFLPLQPICVKWIFFQIAWEAVEWRPCSGWRPLVPPWMELRREEASEEDDVAEELFSSRSWDGGRAEIQYK